MTNYDLIQMMPKSKLAELLLDFALKCQSEDDKFFDLGVVRYDKIEKWLSADIKGEPADWEHKFISALDINPSVYEALYVAGIRTLGDLVKYRAYDLKRIPHIGDRGVEQILTQFEMFTGVRIKP